MEAAGYIEKVPPKIQEENMAKWQKLLQEVSSLEGAFQHLELDIAAQGATERPE